MTWNRRPVTRSAKSSSNSSNSDSDQSGSLSPQAQVMNEMGNATRSRPNNVPIVKSASTIREGFFEKNAGARQRKFASLVKRSCVGPMPIEEFLDAFLPLRPENTMKRKGGKKMAQTRNAFRSVPRDPIDEREMYRPLCNAINSRCRCPSFQLVEIPDHAKDRRHSHLQPGLCLYRNDELNETLDFSDESSHLGLADVLVEVRTSREWDPFRDPDPGVDPSQHNFLSDDEQSGNKGRVTKSIGQAASSVAELCARQHRTHCFSISIYGPTARLLRWDRSGVVVSRAFDYHEHPEWLCQFLWRYGRASESERGFDMTIQKASLEEEAVFLRVITEHVKEQARPCDSTQLSHLVDDHYEKGKVYKIALYPQQPLPPKKRMAPTNVKIFNDRCDTIAPLHARKILQMDDGLKAPCEEAPSGKDTQLDKGTSGNAKSFDVEKFLNIVKRRKAKAAEPDVMSDTDDEADDSCGPDDTDDRTQSICRRYTAIQHFLVSRPVTIPLSATGRATRGYWAVKIPNLSSEETDYRIAFIKDTWREAAENIEKEGEIMVELVEADVPNVSDIFCHGDIVQGDGDSGSETETKYENTMTDKYQSATWNCNKSYRLIAHVHYRMAMVEVGYPLKFLLGTKELIHTTLKAFIAAWEAFKRCRRLHRDISANNIVLVRKEEEWRVGILIDWEMSSKAGKSGKARDHDRLGTWAFMSIKNLEGNKKFRHSFQDDMESFFYVVLYASLRWLAHNQREDLELRLSQYFNENRFIVDEKARGGSMKVHNVVYGTFVDAFKWNNAELAEWIENCLAMQKRAFLSRSEWSPESLFELWVFTDSKNLPNNDRHVHLLMSTDEIEEPSFASNMSKKDMPSNCTGSKRSAEIAGLECDSNASPKQRLRRSKRLAKRISRE